MAIENDFVVIESDRDSLCPECRYYLDRNLTTVKALDPDGKPSITTSTGIKFLDFPLQVGKEWSQDIDLRQTSTGQIRPYSNHFRVEAYEEVTVKAGTFKAFRIAWHQVNLGPYRWHAEAAYWWSPETGCAVKGEAYDTQWFRPFELVSYTKN